jgi:hypothetical protein
MKTGAKAEASRSEVQLKARQCREASVTRFYWGVGHAGLVASTTRNENVGSFKHPEFGNRI